MNKADYQNVAGICILLGIVLVLSGSASFSFYSYTPFIVFGGMILIVIGLGFRWRARQEK